MAVSTSLDGYKEPRLGSIPDDWETVTLSEVVEFTQKPRDLQVGDYERIPFLPMELIPDDGIEPSALLTRAGVEIRSGTYFEAGDILLAKITPSFENGKQAIVADLPLPFGYATTEVFPLRPRQRDRLSPLFLFYYLKHPSVRSDIANRMEGTTGRQRVPRAVLENYVLPLPPLPEQRRIAHVLGTIQQAIEAQERVINAAREFKRSLMQRLFKYGPLATEMPTKETQFGDVPADWREVSLSQHAHVQTGVAKGRKLDGQRTIEVPYLRVANVQDGHLDLKEIKRIWIKESELDRYSLQDGDVVLTEGGDFDKLGRGFIWKKQVDPCIHQNHIFAVRTDRQTLLPEYLAYLVQSEYGKRYFLKVAHRTTNLASINSTKLKAFPLLLAPLRQQRLIAEQLQKADDKIHSEESRKTALEALFKSMLHDLMTGRIRVDNLEVGQ